MNDYPAGIHAGQSNFCPVNTSPLSVDSQKTRSKIAFCACRLCIQKPLQKERSPNVLYEEDIGSLLPKKLAAGPRLAAENESQEHDEKTSRPMSSGSCGWSSNGDVLCCLGPTKGRFWRKQSRPICVSKLTPVLPSCTVFSICGL